MQGKVLKWRVYTEYARLLGYVYAEDEDNAIAVAYVTCGFNNVGFVRKLPFVA